LSPETTELEFGLRINSEFGPAPSMTAIEKVVQFQASLWPTAYATLLTANPTN
jgi:hypothetical protein